MDLFTYESNKESSSWVQDCLSRGNILNTNPYHYMQLKSSFKRYFLTNIYMFDIYVLQDIRRLFPSDYNPFYAGFGNRDTDELSYSKIGIPKGKIFIINPKVCIHPWLLFLTISVLFRSTHRIVNKCLWKLTGWGGNKSSYRFKILYISTHTRQRHVPTHFFAWAGEKSSPNNW